MRTSIAGIALLVAAACSHPDEVRPRTNVLLITFDTTRADHLGCYGDRDIETPALDSLAAQGLRFANAFSPAPITLVAHTTLLTGMPPFAHGLRDNGAGCLAPEVETYAEFLHGHGFHTAAVIGAVVLARAYGLAQGFDVYDDHCPIGRVSGGYRSRRATDVADRAIELLLQRPKDRPFFFWLHFFDPHEPYEPPEPEKTRYAARPYDGEIAYADGQLARVLAALAREGLAEQTLVVMAADHGESLGEHGEATHGFFVYDATQHVPLLMRGPGLPSGRVVDALVDLSDVMPTVSGLIGIAGPKPGSGRDLSRSLVDGKTEIEERPVYLESFLTRISMGWSGVEGVRTSRFKFIESPAPELYDLAADPGETASRFEEQGAQQFRQALERLKRSARAFPAGSVAIGDTDRKALEALGYVGAGRGSAPQQLDPRKGLDPKQGLRDVFPRVMEARSLQQAGNNAGAARIFENVLIEFPDDLVARDGLAACQIGLGEIAKAEANLKELINRRPEMKSAWLNLAAIAMAQKRTQDAVELYEHVLRLDDSSVQALDRLSQCHEQLGHLEAARSCLERAIDLLPKDLPVRAQLVERLAKLTRKP